MSDRIRCPDCGAYVRDAGDGLYVNYSGGAHRCKTRERGTFSHYREKRCEYTIFRPEAVPTYQPSGPNAEYPWAQMQPDDFFDVPVNGESPRQVVNRISTAGNRWCRRNRPECRVSCCRVKGATEIRVSMVPGGQYEQRRAS